MGTDVDSDERRLTEQINSREIVELGAHFQEKFYAKVSDIGAYINEKFVIGYTISGLTKWLYPHDFRYKHIKPVHAKLNPEEQQTFDVVNRFVETFNTETALDFFLKRQTRRIPQPKKFMWCWINWDITAVMRLSRVAPSGWLGINDQAGKAKIKAQAEHPDYGAMPLGWQL